MIGESACGGGVDDSVGGVGVGSGRSVFSVDSVDLLEERGGVVVYRLVPPQVWARLQRVLLAVTAIVGVGVAVTPQDATAVLSVIEHAMSSDVWAFGLAGCSVVAAFAEWLMVRRRYQRWVLVVSYCHIVMCALFAGYATSALAGLIASGKWWSFGTSAMLAMMSYLHFIYIRKPLYIRKPRV